MQVELFVDKTDIELIKEGSWTLDNKISFGGGVLVHSYNVCGIWTDI